MDVGLRTGHKRTKWLLFLRVLALAFSVAFSLNHSPCFAQLLASASNQQRFDLNIHFVPDSERKPVPFEFAHGVIAFKTRVAGREVWALFDNGMARTFIDAGFARSCGLKISSPVEQMRTGKGSLDVRRVSSVGILIPGQFEFTRSPMFAEDFSAVSRAAGRPISLVIGKDVIGNFLWLISTSDRSFRVGQSGSLRVRPGAPTLVLKNNQAQLDIAINGQPAVVTVDLGNDAAVSLSDAAWNRLGLNESPSIAGTAMGADGHIVKTKSTIANDLSVGPINAHDVAVTTGSMLRESGDGLLGMGFFSHYDFFLDLKVRRIWLAPHPDAEDTVDNAMAAQSSLQK